MEKYAILLDYYDKQWALIQKLQKQIVQIDVASYEFRYVFALKTQQFYTAIEDLLKQVAKSFENHIQDFTTFQKELLVRLHMSIPSIRPNLLSETSFQVLDKILAFRDFVRHAYDCELLESELRLIQNKIKEFFQVLENDFLEFRNFVKTLC